jgi:hypothetical protein
LCGRDVRAAVGTLTYLLLLLLNFIGRSVWSGTECLARPRILAWKIIRLDLPGI